jgi:hypothetical protein
LLPSLLAAFWPMRIYAAYLAGACGHMRVLLLL